MTIKDVIAIWALKANKNILDFFATSDIDSRLNAEDLMYTMIRRHGSAFPLITDSIALKTASDSWWKTHKNSITRIIDALYAEYNPIENYDKTEDNTRTNKGTRKDVGNETNDTRIEHTINENEKINVSAFDSETYQPKEENTTSGTNTDKHDIKNNKTNTQTDDFIETIKNRTHGNIGVTTNQQMIESELQLRITNIYDRIIDSWAYDFTLGVY